MEACFNTLEAAERDGPVLPAVRITGVVVLTVCLISVLVLLVREGLLCKLVEELALTEEETSEGALTFFPGRTSWLLSDFF